MKRSGFKKRVWGEEKEKNNLPHRWRERRSARSTVKVSRPLRQVRKTEPMSEYRIKQELTKLTSLIVRMRDKSCVLCASRYKLQNGHFWHRDLPPTEFDLTNCNALCARCNNRHEYRPEAYTEWMKQKLGEVEFDRLDRLAHSERKSTYLELWTLRDTYRQLFKEMNAMREVA